MSEARVRASAGASAPAPAPPVSPLRALWTGGAAFVPAAWLATVAVLAFPHARGIGFPLPLRFAVVTPTIAVTAVGAAFLYRALAGRPHPRRSLASALAAAAVAVAATTALAGGPALALHALPMLALVATTLSLLVPRWSARPPVRFGRAAIVGFGALAIAGALGARATETVPSPEPGRAAFDVPREVFDVEHRFVDLPDGSKIHYVDEGAGPTLLFLHGNPSWSFQWRDLIRGLRGTHRCVALDYPGFGMSEAPPGFGYTPREESLVVDAFVEQLGLGDVTLVMQDWGGPIGLAFAARHPERVHGVVLGSTWAAPTTTELPRGKFSLLVGGPIGELAQINFNAFVAAGQGGGVVRALSPAERDGYRRPFVPLSRRGIAAFYPGQIVDANPWFIEVEAGLARLADKPALIYRAMRDPGSDREDIARFERAFPRHRTVDLPDADHFFFEDVGPQMVRDIQALTGAASAAR